MRPNQQNRRMRGRSNRKGPNPLTRSYESNGPDVKIRGSAQQIADKYATLARDAQASGDRVMAENYLQHAEHYNRIIAAAQSQQQSMRDNRDDRDDQDDIDDREQENENVQSAGDAGVKDGSGPQPVINGTPAEVALEEQAVASGENNGSEKRAPKQRRPRRPRREASAGGEDAAETEAKQGDDEASTGSELAATGS